MPSQRHSPWLRLRIWAGKKICKPYVSPQVLRIGFGQVLKRRCHPAEVQAMMYIHQHTSIPVPRVIRTYGEGGTEREDVIMQHVSGEPLAVAWPRMPEASKQAVIRELAGYVEQLPQLVSPKPGFVGSVSMGSGYDHRFGGDRFGPFDNMEDFHTYILRHNSLDAWKEETDVVQVHSNPNVYATEFTHGDLVPSNIIVKDGKIAAIIDWETAGWFPEYWEYTKIRYQWRPYREEYYEAIDRVMVTYPVELRAEQAIWKRYDWYAYELP